MKAFFQEYGLSVILGCIVCLLVVMVSPVGASIKGGLTDSTDSVKNTGTEVQAKAGKSIKSLAGEEEPVPDTIFIGYNSSSHTLVFSHDENSAGYSGCDVKYGNISDNSAFSAWAPSPYMTNPAPYENFRSSITSVNIENTIKPKSMTYWFADMNNITSLDVSNVDSSSCESMSGCFSSKNISNITYGTKFVAPTTIDYMFASPSTLRNSYGSLCSNGNLSKTLESAPRPSWYDLDKVVAIETTCIDGWNWTYTFNCKGYNKLLAYDFYNKNSSSFTGMSFSKNSSNEKKSNFLNDEDSIINEFTPYTNSNQIKYFTENIPTNAATCNISAHLGSGPPLNYNGNTDEQRFTMKVLLVK